MINKGSTRMKLLALFATAISILFIPVLIASASAPKPYPITINSRADNAPPVMVFRANETVFRALFKDGSTASDLTGTTPFMAWSSNATSTAISTSSWTIVNNLPAYGFVDFTFSPESVNHAPGRYIYEIGVVAPTGTRTYRQGVFVIVGSPFGTGADPVSWSTNWNLSLVTLTGTIPLANLSGITSNQMDSGTVAAFLASGQGGTFNHSALSNLTWTASGHEGIAGRLALFSEGGQAGYAGFGAGMYLDGDDNIAASNQVTGASIAAAGGLTNAAAFDPAGSAAAVSNALAAGSALGGTSLQPNAVTGADALGSTFSNGLITTIGNLTPWTGQGYLTNVVWGSIGGTLSDQTDLTNTVALAASALQPGDVVEYDAAHFNPDHWTWTTNANEITLTSYSGPNDVIIPGWIDGLPVVGFGLVFDGNGDITRVRGGENVLTISNSAFYYNTALTNVVLLSVRSIGANAFEFCSSLELISFSASLESIGGNAFGFCLALASVTFSGNAPTEGFGIYYEIPPNQVTNYVTDPTATGWGVTFGGMPVVRLGVVADSYTLNGDTITEWPTGGSGGITNLTITGSGVVTGGSFTATSITLDRTDAWRMDNFLGPREDLGSGTAIVWEPTKYSAKWAPTNAATFSMSENATYPRGDYKLWVTTTNAITFGAGIQRIGATFTASGTNLWIIGVGDSTTNWIAAGRAF
jgi:hypothetical protein